MNPRVPDLSGRRFGRWTVLHREGSNGYGASTWKCVCLCGVERVLASNHLNQGQSTSCGCARLDAMKKLRGANHPRWKGGITKQAEDIKARRKAQMKKRCQICGARNNLVWDHNHKTGEYRGTLCESCNRGIGFFFDKTLLLKRAIEYLGDSLC